MAHPVFLSSLTARLSEQLGNVRHQIYWGAGGGTLVYVDEEIHKRLPSGDAQLQVADELLDRIKEAEVFLCILAGDSHGSKISMSESVSRVSFFEIELFAAALFRKKIVVLRHQNFQPEPALEALLEILAFAFPSWKDLPALDTEALIKQAIRVAEESAEPSRRALKEILIASAKRVAEALYIGRAAKGVSIQFLHGKTAAVDGQADRALVASVLNSPSREENHQRRLSRTWFALRELNTMEISAQCDPWQLESLEQALATWQAAGGWYGLHADMPLGCLAALNTIRAIRERRAALGALPAHVPAYPAAELASAKYNIAKHLYIPGHRRARLLDAHHDVNLAVAATPGTGYGPLTVRSNIRRRLGHVFEATDDLANALKIAKAVGASPDTVAATTVELGFTYLYTLRLRPALRLCEEGVETLRALGARTQLGRMLRKLAVVYAANGMYRRAITARDESRTLAADARAYDQLR